VSSASILPRSHTLVLNPPPELWPQPCPVEVWPDRDKTPPPRRKRRLRRSAKAERRARRVILRRLSFPADPSLCAGASRNQSCSGRYMRWGEVTEAIGPRASDRALFP